MKYFLSQQAVLKWLEKPCVYHMAKDELYELDNASFAFLSSCMSDEGCNTKDSAFIDYCLSEDIIAEESAASKRPVVSKAPEPSLRYLELQVTNACNLRCKHCYIGDGGPRELSAAQVRTIMTELDDMQGLRALITGGEPLMHAEFAKINELLPEFFVRKALFTNGLLLNDDILKRLNVQEIHVSIDGLEEAHDSLRGAGTFARAIDAVERSLGAGFDVSVATMVHRGNLGDFDQLEGMFREMGIKDWTVDVPCATGRLKDHPELQIDPGESGTYLGYGYGSGLHSTGPGFGCGLHLMAVMSDGRISKCAFYPDQAVGTVEDGARSCWKKIEPVRIERLACNCAYLDVCRGGCRYRAELTTGKWGKDPYRCAMYGII